MIEEELVARIGIRETDPLVRILIPKIYKL